MNRALVLLAVLLPLICFGAAEPATPLLKANINLRDQASLQRGAKIFMNYCSGCHSLRYIRYNRMAKDIGIVDESGQVDKELLKENLIFSNDKVSDPILSALSEPDGKQWFGISPPDLTLIARIRGVDWVYTYLRSFYKDTSRPWGTNNLLVPNVAMPNVLVELQGIQIPTFTLKTVNKDGVNQQAHVIDHLLIAENGVMTSSQFDATLTDLVNFLAYVSEPIKVERERLGYWALGFLIIFAIATYLLKKSYWKDIK